MATGTVVRHQRGIKPNALITVFNRCANVVLPVEVLTFESS